jgi:hypothetical protein
MVEGSLNVDLYIDGAARTRKGFTKALTDADATTHAESSDGVSETLGVHQFMDPNNIRCLVRIARATANSNTGGLFSSGDVCIEYNTSDLPDTISSSGWTLSQTTPGTADTLGNTGTADQYVDFVSYNGRLYVACPGLSSLEYLTYSSGFTSNTVTDSSSGTSGVNKPKGVEEWYGRIWTYMDESIDDGSYLYWTDLAGTTIGADNYVLIPGEGPITGIARVNRNLLVFKGSETFILSGGDDPVANLRVETVSREFGCIARRSIVQVEGGVYWMSRRGFFFFDGSMFSDISRSVKPEFDSIAISQVEKIHGVHNKEQDTVNWFAPYAYASGSGYGVEPYGDDYGGGGYFIRCLSYDFSAQAWSAPFANQDFIASCTYVNSTATGTEAAEIVIACRTGDYDNHVMRTMMTVTTLARPSSPSRLTSVTQGFTRSSGRFTLRSVRSGRQL